MTYKDKGSYESSPPCIAYIISHIWCASCMFSILLFKKLASGKDQGPHISIYKVYVSGMGWLRLVGSFKVQASFVKKPYNKGCILQKGPIISRSLLLVAPPGDIGNIAYMVYIRGIVIWKGMLCIISQLWLASYVFSIDICVLSREDPHTGWRRLMGCPIFIGHFPQKSPVVSGSVAKNDLQLKESYGSLPSCISKTLGMCVVYTRTHGMWVVFKIWRIVYRSEVLLYIRWMLYITALVWFALYVWFRDQDPRI